MIEDSSNYLKTVTCVFLERSIPLWVRYQCATVVRMSVVGLEPTRSNDQRILSP